MDNIKKYKFLILDIVILATFCTVFTLRAVKRKKNDKKK